MLSGINHQLGRNKVFGKEAPLRFAAMDGHEFFSQSREARDAARSVLSGR
jgi:hypothetical protein